MTDRTTLLSDLKRAVLDGSEAVSAQAARRALEAGIPPLAAIDEGCIPGIREAGRLWEEGEYFLPELVTSAQALKTAMAILQPALSGAGGGTTAGRVVIGTVQGDIHDIGKTLVATLLAANGFTVFDEGADVPVERFVDRAREVGADLVCASALLTTTMTVQARLASALRTSGVGARLMVGGAPVNAAWAAQIGAHGYADNAVAAVEAARRLVSHV